MDRRISFEKIQNARDLGGLATREGRVIPRGLLLRSAKLHGASDGDIQRLEQELHLEKIIDLRTAGERQGCPDPEIPGAEYCPIGVFDERVAGISHEQDELASIPPMETLYGFMATDESCRKNLGRAARAVMEHNFGEGSVLWHCTEGKDRCGLLAVVLLMALGVDREQIMEDYLLTNEVNGPKAQSLYERALSAGKSSQEAQAVRNVFLAKESYLQVVFDVIDKDFPEDGTFLTEGLSIPEQTIHHFREQVLLCARQL